MARTAQRIGRAAAAALVAIAAALALVVAHPLAAHADETDTIYSLVNEARWADGSAGLVRNANLDAVAEGWATQLAQTGKLSHNPDYSSQIPGGWTKAAENVAQGYRGGAAMHEGWMNSDGHRENILGDFTDIGIAYVESGGTTWGVEVFAKYSGHVGPAAPAAAEAAPATPEPSAATPTSTASGPATVTPTASPKATADPVATTATSATSATSNSPPLWPLALWILPLGILGVLGVRRYLLRAKTRRRPRHAA